MKKVLAQVAISQARFPGQPKGKRHGENSRCLEKSLFAHCTRFGKVLQPLKIAALDRKLLLAFGHMEFAQQQASQMSSDVKLLARILAAMQVSCPWCIDIGMLESKELGIPEEKIYALLEYQRSPLFTEAKRGSANS